MDTKKVLIGIVVGGALILLPGLDEDTYTSQWVGKVTPKFDTPSGMLDEEYYALNEHQDGYWLGNKDQIVIPFEEVGLDDTKALEGRTEAHITGNTAYSLQIYFGAIDSVEEISLGDYEKYKKNELPPPTETKDFNTFEKVFAAPSFDTNTTTGYTANASSLSWTHVNSGNLVVAGIMRIDATSGDRAISAMSYAGVTMTTTAPSCTDIDDATYQQDQYYLVNPATGSNSFSVTFGGTNTHTLATGASAVNANTFLTASSSSILGSPRTQVLLISPANDVIVFDFFNHTRRISLVTVTPLGSQIQMYNTDLSTAGQISTSYRLGTATSSVTEGYTYTSTGRSLCLHAAAFISGASANTARTKAYFINGVKAYLINGVKAYIQ